VAAPQREAPRLIGDIGATNARFALLSGASRIERPRTLACDDFPSLQRAISGYFTAEAIAPKLSEAAFAIASPIIGDEVRMTNHPWQFTIAGLKQELGLRRLLVINDFTATALAVPLLSESDRVAIGGGTPTAGAPIGVLGPGTGLGVSGLVPTGSGWIPISGEGGHVTLAAADARESLVLDRMRLRFDHVSAERALSGQGLINIYNILCELEHRRAAALTPAQIADPGIREAEPCAGEALAMFCAMLGTIAGNLALTLGARGGIYIAGGIVPRLGGDFTASQFRQRFEAKGRFSQYLQAIPTYVVNHPYPAFLGLAALLAEPGR
jgi:glucokinase